MAYKFLSSNSQSFLELKKLVSYQGLVRSSNCKIIVFDDSLPATQDKYLFNGVITAGGFFYFPAQNSMIDLFDLGDTFILGINTDQNLEITIIQSNENDLNKKLYQEIITYNANTFLPIQKPINFKYFHISFKNTSISNANVIIALTLIP